MKWKSLSDYLPPFRVIPLLWVWLLVVGVGWLMMFSASINISDAYMGHPFYFAVRHAFYILLATGIAWLVICLPTQIWQKMDGLLLLLAIIGLVAVLLPGIGHTVNGSARWIDLVLIKLQPSEFAKLAAVLYVAGYLVRRQEEVQDSWFGFIKPILVLGSIVMLLLMEPDFGSVVVLMGAVLVMLFLGGVKAGQFFLLLVGVFLLGYVGLMSEEYRATRLLSFLNPFHPDHLYGSGYQLSQSLIAFGRGQLFGVGLGESVQKLFYLPEAHTDFVFAIWAEETGLIGALFAMSLLLALLWHCIKIGLTVHRAGQLYVAYVCFGITTLLALQIMINIGVNIGLLPTKGLTLPFFSYGGSSFLMSNMMVAIVYRIQLEWLEKNENS